MPSISNNPCKDLSPVFVVVALLFFLISCGGDEEEIQPADVQEEDLSKEVIEEIPEVAGEPALEPAKPEAVNPEDAPDPNGVFLPIYEQQRVSLLAKFNDLRLIPMKWLLSMVKWICGKFQPSWEQVGLFPIWRETY